MKQFVTTFQSSFSSQRSQLSFEIFGTKVKEFIGKIFSLIKNKNNLQITTETSLQAVTIDINNIAFFSQEAVSPSATHTAKHTSKGFFKNPFFLPYTVIVILLATVIYLLYQNATHGSSKILGTVESRLNLNKPIASQTLNKTYEFPITDASGNKLSTIKYQIQNAEQRDVILIKGQEATAVKGRTFLILNLKITNDYTKGISLNARDYVRLVVNGANEKLAPEIHNDPVEVQATSTKYTRIGFPIDDNYKTLELQVGEINGKKDSLKLNLK